MKYLFVIVFTFAFNALQAQHDFAFTHITTEDGLGLSNNIIRSIYQDEKGFIWVGTDNGIQRFDGGKFISFTLNRPGSDELPHNALTQIIAGDSGKLILAFSFIHEFGIFDPLDFSYKKILIKNVKPVSARAEFAIWRDSKGELYLNIYQYGILHYNKKQNAFIEDNFFPLPKNYLLSQSGVFEDVRKQQYWFACDSGLCVYNMHSKQMWTKNFNPENLPVLRNKTLQDRPTEIYIDKQRRYWIFCWPLNISGQVKYCLDSTGNNYLKKDTAGLLTVPKTYTEYTRFFETKKNDLWIYGTGVLLNYDKNTNRFYLNKSNIANSNNSLNYDVIYQLLEDKDGNMWIATDKGLYFTSYASGTYSVINFLFDKNYSITDILEMPGGTIWFTTWGDGLVSLDRFFKKSDVDIYKNPPPFKWTEFQKNAIKLTWCLTSETATGKVWIGCQGGVLLVYDTLKKTTEYLYPTECNGATIRYIIEDKKGQLWLGTQGGRLIKWSNDKFSVVQDIGAIIYKIFFDRQGEMWIVTQEKGLYNINPDDGKIIKHYMADGTQSSLYANTATDIEQLNDSVIIVNAGNLNFINKRTGKVKFFRYEDGLPSNRVARLRMDSNGYLWIITSNGLCRYNPANNRITPYDRKDGIVLGELTIDADYRTNDNHIIFAGSNGIIMFESLSFVNTQPPTNVSITDFKIFNHYIPVDSLLQLPEIKLNYNQNSFSIYFASLSYIQRERVSYYYKMEGIDKSWTRDEHQYYVNYSLLPPGHYTFKVYCENLEGLHSGKITELHVYIKPQFWRTKWFASVVVFVLLLIIYIVQNARIKRLLSMEKLRTRVARDLHDDMGSTLSTINILSAMAKTKMNTDAVKTTEYLSKISDNSQRMMEAMDDIVWSIKPTNDSMQKITARMREFATNVLEAKDIDLNFNVDEKVSEVKLNMEVRRDFFLVFKEAVNNAAKYSKANKVQVNINISNKKLSLLIIDDGIGFDLNKADNGNGLGNMQKRVDAMNGKLLIDTEPGQGSKVIVTIPVL